MNNTEELHKWLLESVFTKFKITKNHNNEEMLEYCTRDIKQLFAILNGNSIFDLAKNEVEPPFYVYFYPDERYIISGRNKTGAYVMHFDLDGNRL